MRPHARRVRLGVLGDYRVLPPADPVRGPVCHAGVAVLSLTSCGKSAHRAAASALAASSYVGAMHVAHASPGQTQAPTRSGGSQ